MSAICAILFHQKPRPCLVRRSCASLGGCSILLLYMHRLFGPQSYMHDSLLQILQCWCSIDNVSHLWHNLTGDFFPTGLYEEEM